uniref:NADH-ubiquinone oxidoreductase chain 5 n=1 Tax=Lysmata vittata TaxID=749979 RepID=A0A7D5TV52_9EUCA|nr:NADH dehydrogenase subunit 5 [Lysmata vittata]QLI42513.1 NADH dehydrogenase subunit 5 [Lysmata vittata]QQP21711.1 NADH dehydrogenase subunit 5 [Lysmata vittata]
MMWKVKLSFISFMFLVIFSFFFFLISMMKLLKRVGVVAEWEILGLNSCSVSMVLLFDWMSCMFMSLVMLISSLVLFYSGGYMSNDENINRFMYLVLGFVSSMMFMIMSPNLISVLLGWDGLGLVSYALVIYYQSEKSCNAGMLTAMSNRIGDVGILMSIGFMGSMGSWNFTLESEQESFETKEMILSLVIMSSMTKSAQIPFSAWLPAAMAAPTPVSALVHSSTLVTAGVYLLIRFSPFIEMVNKGQISLLLLSSLTMFMAGLGANFETDLKKIIALSTLSQLGVMMFSISLGWSELAFFHLLTHALFKALLFLCAGSVIHSSSDYQDIRMMGGLVNFMPLSVVSMNLANFALCGIPFLAGFYSKDLILENSLMSELNVVCFFLIFLSTGLTASYSFRMVFFTMTGEWNMSSSSKVSDDDEIFTHSMSGLILGSVFGGSLLMWVVFPSPTFICLTIYLKLLTLMVIVLGVFFGYMLNIMSYSDDLSSLKSKYLTYFSSSMWFLPFMSTYSLSVLFLKAGSSFQKSGDVGWFEFYGAQGSYSNFMLVSKWSQMLQDNSVKLYMMMMVLWMFGIMMLEF